MLVKSMRIFLSPINLNYKPQKWKCSTTFSAKWRPRSPKSSASKTVSLNPKSLTALAEYRKVIANKQLMAEKKNENDMVLTEFNMLAEDANVFKLVGPVLAKQDLAECKTNVTKRIEFIGKEINRLAALETEFQGKVTDKTANIKKMQNDMQRMVMQAQ
jgi:prefoldin beta subunit